MIEQGVRGSQAPGLKVYLLEEWGEEQSLPHVYIRLFMATASSPPYCFILRNRLCADAYTQWHCAQLRLCWGHQTNGGTKNTRTSVFETRLQVYE